MTRYERVENAEPTNFVAALTSVISFVALLGADVHTLQSAATALGISGTQALFTRQHVYSPKSIEEIKGGETSLAKLGELLQTAKGGLAKQREPAVAIGAATALGGFLVQFFTGVGMTEALVSAAGIAGVQGAVTRGRVYSPASARRAAAAESLAKLPPEEVHEELTRRGLLPTSG